MVSGPSTNRFGLNRDSNGPKLGKETTLMDVRWTRVTSTQWRRRNTSTRRDLILIKRRLESGHTIIIENLGESLDAVLAPVIQRATIKRGRTLYVKVGDSEVEFHPDFRC